MKKYIAYQKGATIGQVFDTLQEAKEEAYRMDEVLKKANQLTKQEIYENS